MKTLTVLFTFLFSLSCLFSMSTEDFKYYLYMNNTDIQKAQKEVEKAELDVQTAKGQAFPTIDLNFSGSYIADPSDPVSIGGVTVIPGQENIYYNFGAEFTQPLFTWGKISGAVSIAKQTLNLRKIQTEDTKNRLYYNTLILLNSFTSLRQIEQLLQKEKTLLKQLEEISYQSFENGMINETDYLKVKISYSEISLAESQNKVKMSEQLNEIQVLTGLYDLDPAKINYSYQADSLRYSDRNSTIQTAIGPSRPAIQIINYYSSVQDKAVETAKAGLNWKPDLAFSATMDYSGSSFDQGWTGNTAFTVALKTTVFDGCESVRNVKRSELISRETEMEAVAGVQDIKKAVLENLNTVELEEATLLYHTAVSEEKEQEIENLQTAEAEGKGSKVALIQSETELINEQIEIIVSQIKLCSAYLTLDYLTK